ncbi:MAG: hypothetical protein LBD44_01335 [Spirochaetaceae bacterium]|jgi:hypothetical protein|nr:hypothetical protein [Spirochaetaceae bacterium]
MKNYARFLIFFGLCFIILFITAVGIAFLHVWVDAVRHVPVKSSIMLNEIVESGCWALPFALYLTIVFSVNEGRRHKVAWPLIFVSAVALAGVFTFGISKGLSNAGVMPAPPLATNHITLGRQGLLLSRPGVVITLLDRPSNAAGSRVVAVKDRELIYQKVPVGADGKIIGLPPIPFHDASGWLSYLIISDLSVSGRFIAARFNEGLIPYFAWTLALIVLLVSLGLVFELTRWPLANIFLGLLIFRGVLAFEVFLNSDKIMEYLLEFTRGAIPDALITPAIFVALSVLVLVYSFLIFLSRATTGADTKRSLP